jgi:hypothetical protein
MRRYETAWNRRGDAVEAEVKQLMKQYEHDPHRLATRTPNVLMAALTVALLAAWVMRRTGLGWFAVLAAAVYTTSPEVFVRSSYGGYFAISQFALLEILLFVDAWHSATRRGGHLGLAVNGLLAGGFAAVACHKLVFLPAAIAAYEVLRGPAESIARRCGRVVRHPVVIGFVAGTLLFWTYGLAIHPGEFWREHFRTHLVDRVLHENPLGYSGYPSPMGLWQEFCRHTGYVLLPLGVTAMAVRFWFRPRGPDASDEPMDPSLPPSSIHIWILWAGGLALAFTLIDWRQTKHLAPLFLPLVMAPAAWAGIHRPARIAVTLILAGLLFWNLGELYGIAADFGSFSVTPGW